jgi:hypothetical protein
MDRETHYRVKYPLRPGSEIVAVRNHFTAFVTAVEEAIRHIATQRGESRPVSIWKYEPNQLPKQVGLINNAGAF